MITIWQIPPLKDRIDSLDDLPPTADNQPLFRQRHCDRLDRCWLSTLVPPLGWRSAFSYADNPLRFDIIYYQGSVNPIPSDMGSSYIDHYVLSPVEDRLENRLPKCLPTHIGKTGPVSESLDAMFWEALGLIGPRESAFFFVNGDRFMVYLSTMPADSAGAFFTEHRRGLLWESPNHKHIRTEVCTFSGRVILLEQHLGTGVEIRIMDYLTPTASPTST